MISLLGWPIPQQCTVIVYAIYVSASVKNITLSAPADAIERARLKARLENTTLNEAFRQWLNSYVGKKLTGDEYLQLMEKLSYVRPGRKFTREEMNERGVKR